MTRWYLCLTFGAFILAGLIGCSEEPSPSAQPQTAAVATPPAAQAPAPEAKEEEAEKAEEFVYQIEGRRDPFVPLSRIRVPLEVSSEPTTPLQNYELGQLRLVGVIVGKGAPKAMVVAPDGKSYVLAKGVKVGKNNGVVVDINGDAVLVKEKFMDYTGSVIENIQEIVVPKREGV